MKPVSARLSLLSDSEKFMCAVRWRWREGKRKRERKVFLVVNNIETKKKKKKIKSFTWKKGKRKTHGKYHEDKNCDKKIKTKWKRNINNTKSHERYSEFVAHRWHR